jgi:hypothetical protein
MIRLLVKPNLIFIIVLGFILLTGMNAYSQHHHHDDHEHSHSLKPNEIGVAVGLVYAITEDAIGTGIHLHYTRMLQGKCEKFGIGGGFEAVIMDHQHYNLSVMAVYRPIHALWISLGPGATYFAEEEEVKLSLHIETGYEFDLKVLHIGPMIEYAFAGSDHHIMIGLHLGFPF